MSFGCSRDLAQISSDGVRGAPDIGVLATRADNGRVDILLWHYQDDDVPGPPADIHLVVSGLAPGLQWQMRVWGVDRQHGDAFTAWKAMGSPAEPTKHQVEQLIRASRMAARPVRMGPQLQDGSVTVERHLPL